MYALILPESEQPVTIRAPTNPRKAEHAIEPSFSRLAILQVCRQLNDEAVHIFYKYNTLRFTDATILRDFLQAITFSRKRFLASLYLKNLHAMLDHGKPIEEGPNGFNLFTAIKHNFYAAELLAECENLGKITFEMVPTATYIYLHLVFLEDVMGSGYFRIDELDNESWIVTQTPYEKGTLESMRDFNHVAQLYKSQFPGEEGRVIHVFLRREKPRDQQA